MTPTRPNIEQIAAAAREATPGPWCYEQCGIKCDAPVVGIAYRADDVDCERPITGRLEECDENGDEIEYYRETVAYEIQDCDGASASMNARHIATSNPAAIQALTSYVLWLEEQAKILPGLLEALQGMVRLSEMGFLESLNEPEENGNFAAFERAKRAIANAAAFSNSLQKRIEDEG